LGGGLEMGGKVLRPVEHVGAVHKGQGLGSDGGGGAAALADEGFGGVEGLHHGDELAALDHEVDAAAGDALVERARAEHRRVELATDGKNAVTEIFGVEAARGEAPEEAIFGIGGEGRGTRAAALLVGGAEHHLFVQGFEAPVVADEFLSEEVEEFGVGRAFALETEIAGGIDEAAAEVMVPEAVDDDAGEEVAGAVFGIGHPVGERASPLGSADVFGG
jgi:hypothetical protein